MAPPPDTASPALSLDGRASAAPRAGAPRPRVRLGRQVRRVMGLLILLAGAAVCVEWLLAHGPVLWSRVDPDVRAAAWGGLLAAGATAVGSLPVLMSRGVHARAVVMMLSFSAGAMLAASLWSLLLPAFRSSLALGHSDASATSLVGCGAMAGAAALVAIDRLCRRIGATMPGDDPIADGLRGSWLFVLAIVLHNVPEGLSIGVGFAGAERAQAQSLAVAIALQDLPEGLVVALALRAVGYGRGAALTAGALSGVVEPIGAVAGAWLTGLSLGVLPWALAAAAGAMLFAIAHAIVPMLWHARRTLGCTAGLLSGVALMSLLDLWFSAPP